MSNRKKILSWLQNNWGLVVTLAVVLVVILRNYTPSLTIAGWDNFSVNFDLLLNFPRTFFATWRAYRGLGVPSDSEVVDIFRQIPLMAISLVTTAQAALNAYYLLLYGVGVVSSYFLTKFFLRRLYPQASSFVVEASCLLAACFYGFNLNTFETFFLPITIYVARFAFLPLFILIFLKMLTMSKRSVWHWLGFFVVTWMLSTAYLTATVFFTVVLVLVLIGISYYQRYKLFLGLMAVFLALNAFWLLTFANYYQQKAELIPIASSFISVNESLLNKPASVFSWQKISTFYPEILSTQSLPFRDVITQASVPVHPLVGLGETNDQRLSVLVILPVLLALIGVGWLIWYGWRKKDPQVIWVILLVFGMLFLLRREYAPLGWLYDWLGTTIPLFKIVFRFGGAKFSPLLVLALFLSLGFAAASLFQVLANSLQKKMARGLSVILVLVVSLVIINPFIGFFTGSLFSSLILVKIPEQYQHIAQRLNSDLSSGRVVHLPMDTFSYWKSYDWGYIGSNFLSFMTMAPIIDRTYEPASLENDFFNSSLQRLIKSNNPDAIYALFQKTGTQYVVFDESVTAQMTSRGLQAWGVFPSEMTRSVVQEMVELGYLQPLQTQTVDISGSAEDYRTDVKYLADITDSNVVVYEVREVDSAVMFISQASNIDPFIANAFIDPLLTSGTHFIQSNNGPANTYPFWQPNRAITLGNSGVFMTQQVGGTQTQLVSQISPAEDGRVPVMVEVAESEAGVKLRFSPYQFGQTATLVSTEITIPAAILTAAKVASGSAAPELTNWQVLPYVPNDSLRLSIDGTILPLPETISSEYQTVGSTLIASSSAEIALLGLELSQQTLVPSDIQLTDNPNCFEDQTTGYDYAFDNSKDVSLTTQNGMTCLSAPLVVDDPENETERLFELNFQYQNTAEYQSPPNHQLQDLSALQRAVRNQIDALPTLQSFSVCLLGPENTCLNAKQWVRGSLGSAVVVPAAELTDAAVSQVLITLPANPGERNSLTITQPAFSTFVPIWEAAIAVASSSAQNIAVNNGMVNVTTPYFLTPNSYFFNSEIDALNSYSGSCVIPTGYRRLVTTEAWPTLSYLENCFQGLSVTLPYQPIATYLWLADYSVFMGKQPQFIARQETELLNEYLSRFSGYPALPGFKSLQMAGVPWMTANPDFVQRQLEAAPVVSTFTTLAPQSSENTQKMTWEISQQGEGQSLLGLQNTTVAELPAAWQNMALLSEGSELSFGEATVSDIQEVWPSLWKITMSSETQDQPLLLKFGQAYDDQWQLFQTSSIVSVILGMNETSADQVRVDGWSNGWLIPAGEVVGEQTLYVFYAPERLALVGWGITLGTAAGVLVWSGLKRRKSKR